MSRQRHSVADGRRSPSRTAVFVIRGATWCTNRHLHEDSETSWPCPAGGHSVHAGRDGVERGPRTDQTGASPLLIYDVTQLNPIHVGMVITPTTTQEIIESVKRYGGPISVGGARHSMGDQIATAGALHIDMRGFNKILAFSPSEKTITVQAGARWRQIQERIDPANLSVSIKQTYANFTVGGSLSVNVHGRYVARDWGLWWPRSYHRGNLRVDGQRESQAPRPDDADRRVRPVLRRLCPSVVWRGF
jgi:hypothetical protein